MISQPAALALGELPAVGPAALTLGVFDGVHRGHLALLDATRAVGNGFGVPSVVLVFDPPPDEVINPRIRLPRLAPLGENLRRIRTAGIDRALPVRFDEGVRRLPAEEFLAALAPRIDLRALVMSEESAFGLGRAGTPERLRVLGRERGFELVAVRRVMHAGEPVSSSRLREAVAIGDLDLAREMGVVPYLEGTVVRGDGRGRELGYPTANLSIDYPAVMPLQGVYAARAAWSNPEEEPIAPALVSIGTRPTFSPDGPELVEVHLLDRDLDLYGSRLRIELVRFLRGQLRFDTAADLVVQMRRDEADARRAFGTT